jgi:hypothetical protein
MADKFVRFDDEEAARMLKEIAAEDRRTEGNTVIILIRNEYERRRGLTTPSAELSQTAEQG